jgi:outer membrane protein insertion porin family
MSHAADVRTRASSPLASDRGLASAEHCRMRHDHDDGNVVRSSVGVGLIWASPFGLRFDYAVSLTKDGGGTSF